MKKNMLIIIGLCALGLCFGDVQAVNNAPTPIEINKLEIADPPQGYEEINLQGTLMLGVGPNAIVAGASDDAVYIGFNQSFGYVNVSIYNSLGGLVYNTVVNTDVQTVVIIPFSSAASGTYTVELNSANGYVDGDFERN